jgi:hypothetical protein
MNTESGPVEGAMRPLDFGVLQWTTHHLPFIFVHCWQQAYSLMALAIFTNGLHLEETETAIVPNSIELDVLTYTVGEVERFTAASK